MSKLQFPSLGEVVKAVFDHSGVLPQKNDNSGIFADEKAKKTVQAQLRRLSKEESELKNNLSQLTTLLENALLEALGDNRLVWPVIESLEEVLVQYGDLIREDGTFLTRSDSIKWLIRSKLLDRIILSYQKNFLKFNVGHSDLTTPSDVYWWLPDITDDSIKWPIAKVFSWIYDTTETNQTHFHFPNSGAEDNHRLSQNLENVSRWCNGKQIPSWGNLSLNLTESLVALINTNNSTYRREVTEQAKKSFKVTLFFARLSTSICIAIERQFGREFLIESVKYMRRQDCRLKKQHISINSIISSFLKASDIHQQADIDRTWYDGIQVYWHHQSELIARSAKIISKRFQDNYRTGYSLSDLRYFLKRTPAFTLRPLLSQREYNPIKMVKPKYFDLLFEGLKIRKNEKDTNTKIAPFIEQVTNANLSEELEWLICWNLASFHYRRNEHNLAFPYYKTAFERAKYSVGKEQYLLVNQYIESCAKNDRLRDFKKGIAWANYLGIEVRWLRNMDESEESVNSVFNLMKIAKYAII